MAGFLRKFAGAFVEIEDEGDGGGGARPGGGDNPDLDEITRDASELLAQLESVREGEVGGEPAAPAASPTGAPPVPPPTPRGTPPVGAPPVSVMEMTADQVFTASEIADGANSAQRVLKLIAGLTMFPKEQQVVMVRAMDAADESWAEADVLEDARIRQSALRSHIKKVDEERGARLSSLQERISNTRSEGQSILDDIDKRVAELQAKRQEAIVETTHAVDALEKQIEELEAAADASRRGITHVINALSGLITFFSKPK